jgi:glucan phosphoethanolaminetransferase (alkaline phosphatase superfamily)
VFLIEPASGLERGIYAFYGSVQAFIEVLCMAILSSWLIHKQWKWSHRLFVFLVSLFLLCRVIDFLLVRLMDISIWHGMEFFFQDTLDNMIEMMLATTIQPAVWFLSLGLAVSFVLVGWLVFYYMHKLYVQKPLFFSSKTLFGFFVLSFALLACQDVVLHFCSSQPDNDIYSRALPWKRTLFMPKGDIIEVTGYLKQSGGSLPWEGADSSLFSLERKPDIFLFIAESLREDFLTKETTPTLDAFRNNAAKFSKTLAPSNATHTSWFSIFYSTYPFHWPRHYNTEWKKGSPTLALLKKMGYEIHVYSASGMNFYSMKRVLFGDKRQNIDSLKEFQPGGVVPCDADGAAVKALCDDISSSSQKGGRLHVVFLDSTHFDYSWPQDQTVFTPIDERVNYLKMAYQRKDLEKLQNRYRNSLRYIDNLFLSFKQKAEEVGIWDDAVVIFTADHGEEYNECGCMFHASNLSSPQIEVPLYMKFGSDSAVNWQVGSEYASTMDIFPTLFHYVLGDVSAASLFDGKSLFVDNNSSCLIGARYNGMLSPYQFYLQSNNYRMTLEFCQTKDIFHSKQLRVLGIENEKGESIPFNSCFVEANFGDALDALFSSNIR